MAKVSAPDGVKLHVEEVGSGTPVVFVHEYAGDYRSWEPQVRHFCRQHRCVTYSQRGYPPSDVPSDPARYSQDSARDDVIAVMDSLGIDKAHVVGHSMGAYTALHVGIRYPRRCLSVTAAGCGWGSVADPAKRDAMRAMAADTGKMFMRDGIAAAAAIPSWANILPVSAASTFIASRVAALAVEPQPQPAAVTDRQRCGYRIPTCSAV